MLTVISTLIAAAILIPLGLWLKDNHAADIGRWTLNLFGIH